MQLKSNIHYVGVNDRQKYLFENLWPLPEGVTYNSYLIDDEKVALIETVDICYFEVFIRKIKKILGERPIDYLVIDHMEPDHSGSIELIRKYYPDITLVGNKKTFGMVEGFYGETGKTLEVKEGSTLSLGEHELTFSMIPMVHWPETMVTYDKTTGTLFSGDAFGCFGALNGSPLDTDQADLSLYMREMERYYTNIVGKYGAPVQRAIKKLSTLDIQMVCSTHGPVWTEHFPEVLKVYDRLSKYEAGDGVVIVYGTMYGNTEGMAEIIAEELHKQGIHNVLIDNVARKHHSFILRDIFNYRGLIVGCPTYNTQIYPQMEALLSKIASRDIKNHIIGWFGSHSWASKAVSLIGQYNEDHLKFEPVEATADMKQGMNPDVEEQCRALARAMAEKLKA